MGYPPGWSAIYSTALPSSACFDSYLGESGVCQLDNFNTEIFTDTDGLKKLKVTRLDNDSGWGMKLELPAKTTSRPIGSNNNIYDFDQKLQILQETDAENQEKLNTLTARINGVNDLITTFDPNDKNVYSEM